MSDTPRTDMEAMGTYDESACYSEEHPVVSVGFARELERENNELRENYNRILGEQREAFECDRKALLQFRDGTWHGRTTKDYTDSISVDPDEETSFFSLAYQWQDKKHRHVFDLCDWINKLQDELKDGRDS